METRANEGTWAAMATRRIPGEPSGMRRTKVRIVLLGALCFLLTVVECRTATQETGNLKVGFETSSYSELVLKDWGSGSAAIVGRLSGDECLELAAPSCAKTGLISYTSGTIDVSLDLKLTNIIANGASYNVCWLTTYWYDASETCLGHSDIIAPASELSDWHSIARTYDAGIPTNTAFYKVCLVNAGAAGTVWVDNVHIISDGVEKNIDFESDAWNDTGYLYGGWGTRTRAGRLSGDECLQLGPNSCVKTPLHSIPASPRQIDVSLEVKQSDVVPWSAPYEVCWLSVQWFDASGAILSHTDIVPTSAELADWHIVSRLYDSEIPSAAAQYKVVLRNAGSAGTVWIDNLHIVSANDEEIVDFESDDWDDVLTGGWGTRTRTGRLEGDECLEMEAGENVKTGLIPYTSGTIDVSLDAKQTDIVTGAHPWDRCWLTVYWYDASEASITHTDIVGTSSEAADWANVAKSYDAQIPTGTAYYQVSLKNNGTTGKVWVDNLHVVSDDTEVVVDFESDVWDDAGYLPDGSGTKSLVGRTSMDKCMELGPSMAYEAVIPYMGPSMTVSMDVKRSEITHGSGGAYEVCWVKVAALDAAEEPFGHRDLLLSSHKADWDTYEKDFGFSRRARYLRIGISNAGVAGTVWVDNVVASVKKEGTDACSDPSFSYNLLNGGHWNAPSSGQDWNNADLFTNGAVRKGVDDSAAGEGSALYIKGNATVYSDFMTVDEDDVLHMGGWARTSDSLGTVDARIQLVCYNSSNAVVSSEVKTLCTLTGDNDWEYFDCEYTAAAPVAKVRAWVRVMENSTGEAWFDEITLVKLDDPQYYYTSEGLIAIDADEPALATINSSIWQGMYSAYLGWALSSRIQGQLQTLEDVGFTRCHMKDILQNGRVLDYIDAYGEPVYDFTRLDAALDVIVNDRDFAPSITIETTPNQISTQPDASDNVYRNIYPPTDFDLWGQILEDTLRHIVDRYGVSEVETWTFEIWDEPGSSGYWGGTQAEFIQLYDQALDALLAVEDENNMSLRKGCISATQNTSMTEAVLEHLDDQDKLQHVDFLSFHVFAGTSLSCNCFLSVTDRYEAIRNSYSAISGVPLHISSFNNDAANAEPVFSDNHVRAAFLPKAYRICLDEGIEQMDFWTGVSLHLGADANKHFAGQCGLTTWSALRKAAANAYILLNKLSGGRRLPLYSSNEPLDGMAVLINNGANLRVLLTTFDERAPDSTADIDVEVTIDWTSMPTNPAATLVRVDEEHGNAYAEWVDLGEPLISETTAYEMSQMEAAAELAEGSFTNFAASNGGISFTLTMQRNSLAYLEFRAP